MAGPFTIDVNGKREEEVPSIRKCVLGRCRRYSGSIPLAASA